MKLFYTLIIGAVFLSVFAFTGCARKEVGSIQWLKTMDAGIEQAEELKKPLMVYYSADWEELSEDFERDVLADPEVVAASEKFVSVHLDSDVHEETAKEYGVSAFPTTVFYNSNGDEIKRIVGYTETDKFLAVMNGVIDGKLETFKELIAREEADPGNLELRYEVAERYIESTRIEKASTRFSSIIEEDPDNESGLVPGSLIYLGFCNMINNDPEGAIEIYERVIEEYPGTEEERKAELYIGDCYRIMDDLDKALEQYKAVADKYPDTEEGKTADSNAAEMEAFEKTVESLFSKGEEEDKTR